MYKGNINATYESSVGPLGISLLREVAGQFRGQGIGNYIFYDIYLEIDDTVFNKVHKKRKMKVDWLDIQDDYDPT